MQNHEISLEDLYREIIDIKRDMHQISSRMKYMEENLSHFETKTITSYIPTPDKIKFKPYTEE